LNLNQTVVMQEKKVAILLPNLKFGGAEKSMVAVGRAMAERGHKVTYILMNPVGELLGLVEPYADIVSVKSRTIIGSAIKIYCSLLSNNIAILISNFWTLNVLSCMVGYLLPKLKIILWEHGMPLVNINKINRFYSLAIRMLYNRADSVVAVSQEVRENIIKSCTKIDSVASVLPIPVLFPEDIYRRKNYTINPFNLVWVGRIDEAKNPAFALDVIRKLILVGPYHLTFIGTGMLLQSLQRDVLLSGLSDSVSFAGYQSDPCSLMANADILIITSVSEGFPLVLIEALSIGLKVVSTMCSTEVTRVLLELDMPFLSQVGDVEGFVTNVVRASTMRLDEDKLRVVLERHCPRVVCSEMMAALN
jgi:glycosyltransferase involved in cell wall biosynthesis